jgi:hypothetical protein
MHADAQQLHSTLQRLSFPLTILQISTAAPISLLHMFSAITAARRVSMFLLPNSRTSATMALQLELAFEQGRLKTGDLFAYVGLAGGISTGLGIFRI